MIDKREILDAASTFGLLPSIVEKDYVLGWLIAGINAHPELTDSWVFKGGTCLKKCYFETYRFSEDLDFTLREEAQLDEVFLRRVLGEVVEWVADEAGLLVPASQLSFDLYVNKRGRRSCEGKVGYRGPVSPSHASGGWPKIKLDLSADEVLVLPPVAREVFHPYSDRPAEGIEVRAYAYEEAFAEKIRALAERTRPRDLYDVVHLYRYAEGRPAAAELREVLGKKCQYKGIPLPTVAALQPHLAELESTWKSMLFHQLPFLPPVAEFLAALPEIFSWLMGGLENTQRAPIPRSRGEETLMLRALPPSLPPRSRGPLETIRFAAANHLCINLTYLGSIREIEPYSLRQTLEGNLVLHAIRSDSGEHRSYRVDKIEGAAVSARSFVPRYVVELAHAGTFTVPPTTGGPSRPMPQLEQLGRQRSRPNTAPSRTSPTYVFRCPICGKRFTRRTMDSKLNPHKNEYGVRCGGTHGVFVSHKY